MHSNLKFIANIRYDDDYNFLISYLSTCEKIYLSSQAYYTWSINAESESHTQRYLPDMWERLMKQQKFKLSWLPSKISQADIIQFSQYYMANSLVTVIVNEEIGYRHNNTTIAKTINTVNTIIQDYKIRYSLDTFNRLKTISSKQASIIYWFATHKMVNVSICLLCLKRKLKGMLTLNKR